MGWSPGDIIGTISGEFLVLCLRCKELSEPPKFGLSRFRHTAVPVSALVLASGSKIRCVKFSRYSLLTLLHGRYTEVKH
jgi:hypothetical protein